MSTGKKPTASFVNVADITPVVSVQELIASVKDGKPGVGGIVWEGWTGTIMAQGIALNAKAKNVWYTAACGGYAGGLRVVHFAKGDTKSEEIMAELRKRVASHFSEVAQKLMAMNGLQVAALDVNQKRDRTDALDAVNDAIKAIKKHIASMEGKGTRSATAQRTPDEILRDMLAECLDYMRKDGGRKGGYDWKFEFGEVFDLVKESHTLVANSCGITRRT